MTEFGSFNKMKAVCKETGTQYIMDTTRVLDADGEIVEEYDFYNFRVERLRIPPNKQPMFDIVRGKTIIGDHTTMQLIFE